MENKDISKIVIDKIKEEGLKPIPKKVFNLQRFFFWIVVMISIIIGAFTFSLILSGLLNNDWDLYNKFGFNFIISTLPYFWFISFILFLILGEYYYRKTLLGYRHTILVIIGVYLALTIICGSIFYVCKVNDLVEDAFNDIPPSYGNLILNRHGFWSKPEEGLISGKIIKIGDWDIKLMDSQGTIWTVNILNSTSKGDVQIDTGRKVKIMGDILDDNNFEADEIRPWKQVN